MSFGTVRWFNRKIGAGFIRTDEGEDVSFINSAVQESQLYSICKDSRVCLEVLKSQWGLTAINVRVAELMEGHE